MTDWSAIPNNQPLPNVTDGYQLFQGEMINAMIDRINDGGSSYTPNTLAEFGALQDGSHNDTVDIQLAFDTHPPGPMLGTGTPALTKAELILSASGFVLRDLSLLPVFTDSNAVLQLGDPTAAVSTTLNAEGVAGGYQLTLTSTTGFVAPELIRVVFDNPTWVMQDSGAGSYPFLTRIESVASPVVDLVDSLPQEVLVNAAVTSIVRSTTTVTVTTTAPHGIPVGGPTNANGRYPLVILKGANEAQFNGTFQLASVPSTTTFTYTTANTGSTNATGTLKWSWNHSVSCLTGALKDATLSIVIDASGKNPSSVISAITQATNPLVTTTAPHGFVNGQSVTVTGPISGMSEMHGAVGTVASATPTTFVLSGIDSTAYGAYTGGASVAVVGGDAITGLIDNCDLDITVKNASGGGLYLTGAYGSRVRVRSIACGNDNVGDVMLLAYTQCQLDIMSEQPSGFGPTLSGGHYSRVSVSGPSRAAEGRGFKTARSRFCFFGPGAPTNTGFTSLAVTWVTQNCTFGGFQVVGSNRPSAQNGGVWTSGCFNTGNKFIGLNIQLNTSFDIQVNDTDTSNQFLGCGYTLANVSLAGSAVGATTFIDRQQILVPQITAMNLIGNGVLHLTDTATGYPLRVTGSGTGSDVFIGADSGGMQVFSTLQLMALKNVLTGDNQTNLFLLRRNDASVVALRQIVLSAPVGGVQTLQVSAT